MKLTASLDAPCSPSTLATWVEDLAKYPTWLSIVAGVDAEADAWQVELQAKLGRLARSKRLRMVRTVHQPDARVRFERREVDGRHHAAWTLEAQITPTETGCHLDMFLGYAGGLWGAVMERLLQDEIDRAKVRLLALVS